MALSKVDVESGGTGLIAAGTSGNVLTSDGTNWTSAAAGGGAWNLISSAVASNSSSITVTGISATYTTYAIVLSDIVSSVDANNIYMRVGDASSMKTSLYNWKTTNLRNNNTSSTYNTSTGDDDGGMQIRGEETVGSNSGEGFGGAIIYLHNARSSISYPSFSGMGTYVDINTITTGFHFAGGYRAVLTGLDRIQIMFAGNNQYNITSGRMSLYGIAHV
jgi:hypothetical protein